MRIIELPLIVARTSAAVYRELSWRNLYRSIIDAERRTIRVIEIACVQGINNQIKQLDSPMFPRVLLYLFLIGHEEQRSRIRSNSHSSCPRSDRSCSRE